MSQTMLYKAPGPHEIHGGQFDYTVIDDEAIHDALADGWSLTTGEAADALAARLADEAATREAVTEAEVAKALADDTKPPTREELEEAATRLGLPFGPRVSDRKLLAMVNAATA